jgi:hypothetical protein
MGLEIRFDDGTKDSEDWIFDLASSGGWSRVIEWVETLPADIVPQLVELAIDGYTHDTFALRDQIEWAASNYMPSDDVLATLGNLIENIGDGDENESAYVLAANA